WANHSRTLPAAMPAAAASRPGNSGPSAGMLGLDGVGTLVRGAWASLAVRLKSFTGCSSAGRPVGRGSVAAGVAEAASAALRCVEFLDQLEMSLHHRHQHQLRDALADGDAEAVLAAVPARHHQFALVVRVDQADQVAEHDA